MKKIPLLILIASVLALIGCASTQSSESNSGALTGANESHEASIKIDRAQLVFIDRDITRSRRFYANKVYVIRKDVYVKPSVQLTVDDGTMILIVNGQIHGSRLDRAALVFSPGSKLVAKRMSVRAGDSNYNLASVANNGGLWFLGNSEDACKDSVCVKTSRATPFSSFTAESIDTHYLGRHDLRIETANASLDHDDIDGISVLGIAPKEWHISEIASYHAADDGFDVTNSRLTLNRLKVVAPVEDAVNLSSSRVHVRNQLIADVTKNATTDRDIFDFETDDGASYLEIAKGCQLDLRGIFGDEVTLSSKDLPQPSQTPDAEYRFSGMSKTAATLIYSIHRD